MLVWLVRCEAGGCPDVTVVSQSTFIVYLGALISFVGWFLFVIYVGIGMVALPMDCFR